MPASIEIRDVRLTPAAEDQLTAIMARSHVTWFDLIVSVRNVSDAIEYVIADVCRMHYDAARRVLQIDFSEHALPDSTDVVGPASPARCKAIEAGQEAALSSRLPSQITFMDQSPEGRRTKAVVRIPEDVDALECAVAYGREPPPRTENLASLEPLRDARRWGATVARSFKLLGRGSAESA